jgi:hypothetical protein
MSTKRDIPRVVLRAHGVQTRGETRSTAASTRRDSTVVSVEEVDHRQYHASFKSFLRLLAYQYGEGRSGLEYDPSFSKLLEFVRDDKCWPETDEYILLRNHLRAEHQFNSHIETIKIISYFEKAWEKFLLLNR